jgi:hypothetical protein
LIGVAVIAAGIAEDGVEDGVVEFLTHQTALTSVTSGT